MLDWPDKERLLAIVGRLGTARVAVVGDMIADVYVFGRPHKLSREAPVVVIRYEGESVYPGSAANTVSNVAALDAAVLAVGAVGADQTGARLVEELRSRGADASGVFTSACETVVKTRILAGDANTVKQQVARIDRDTGFFADEESQRRVSGFIAGLARRCNVLVVSDYGYRTITDRVRDAILSHASGMEIIVDSHDRLSEFPRAWMVTPNENEAEKAAGMSIASREAAEEAALKLKSDLNVRNVLVTRGNQGMTLACAAGVGHIPICGSEEIMDVSGAGDTVVALLAAARSVGATELEAAQLANVAAGIVVMKRGTATCTRAELEHALRTRPLPAGA